MGWRGFAPDAHASGDAAVFATRHGADSNGELAQLGHVSTRNTRRVWYGGLRRTSVGVLVYTYISCVSFMSDVCAYWEM